MGMCLGALQCFWWLKPMQHTQAHVYTAHISTRTHTRARAQTPYWGACHKFSLAAPQYGAPHPQPLPMMPRSSESRVFFLDYDGTLTAGRHTSITLAPLEEVLQVQARA